MSSAVGQEEATPGDVGGTSRGSSKSSKLDSLLQKLQSGPSADHSRENSPELPVSLKDSSQAGSSSRRRSRKPAVIRKVVESEDECSQSFMADMEEPSSPHIEYENPSTQDTADKNPETNGDGGPMETIDIDEHGNFILPEGTVLVEPEDVEEEVQEFKGPEFRSSRKRTAGENDIIICSACNKQINQNVTNAVRRHPVLKVLICKRCYNYYTSDEIDQDTDGCDDQCRWCGEGGDLLCCDYCHNAFCKPCIKRNLGRTELANIVQQDPDAKWHCYVCNPKPLTPLVQHCDRVLKSLEEAKKRQLDKEKKDSRRDSSIGKDSLQSTSSKGKHSAYTSPKNSQKKKTHSLDPVVNKSGSQSNVESRGITISPINVEQILKKLLAATQSMNTVMESFCDDLTGRSRNGPSSNRTKAEIEVSKKLTRAYMGYKQSLEDIESFSRSSSVAPRPVGHAIKHGTNVPKPHVVQASRVPQNMVLTSRDGKQRPLLEVVGGTIIGINPSLKQKVPKPPVQIEEVIELSDSSDDFEHDTVKLSPKKVNLLDKKSPHQDSGKKGKMQPGENSKSPQSKKSKNKSGSKTDEDNSAESRSAKKSFSVRVSLGSSKSRVGQSDSNSVYPEDSENNSVSSEEDKDEGTAHIQNSSERNLVDSKPDPDLGDSSLNDKKTHDELSEVEEESEISASKTGEIVPNGEEVKSEKVESEPVECDSIAKSPEEGTLGELKEQDEIEKKNEFETGSASIDKDNLYDDENKHSDTENKTDELGMINSETNEDHVDKNCIGEDVLEEAGALTRKTKKLDMSISEGNNEQKNKNKEGDMNTKKSRKRSSSGKNESGKVSGKSSSVHTDEEQGISNGIARSDVQEEDLSNRDDTNVDENEEHKENMHVEAESKVATEEECQDRVILMETEDNSNISLSDNESSGVQNWKSTKGKKPITGNKKKKKKDENTDKENVIINANPVKNASVSEEEGNIIQLDGAQTHNDGEKDPARVSRRMKTTPKKGKMENPRSRSRADIEAQRLLHLELLEDNDSEDEDNGEADDRSLSDDILESSDNTEEQKSSGDEYDPEEDQWRDRSSRVKSRSKGIKDKWEKFRELRAKRKQESDDSDASNKQSKKKRKGSEHGKRKVKDVAKCGKSKKSKPKTKSKVDTDSDASSEVSEEKNGQNNMKQGETDEDMLEDYMESMQNDFTKKKKKTGKKSDHDSELPSDEQSSDNKASKSRKKNQDSESDFEEDTKKKKNSKNQDSESDFEEDTKKKKSSKKHGGKTSSTSNKESKHSKSKESKLFSDSEDSDNLNKEIAKLIQLPKLDKKRSKGKKKSLGSSHNDNSKASESSAKSKKKKDGNDKSSIEDTDDAKARKALFEESTAEEDSQDEDSSEPNTSKSNIKEKKKSKKADEGERKRTEVDDILSGSSDEEELEEKNAKENSNDDSENSGCEEDEDTRNKGTKRNQIKEDPDKSARRALLACDSSSEDDDNSKSDNSDDGSTEEKKKTKKSGNKTKSRKSVQLDSDFESASRKKGQKKKKKDKLLAVRLSESDSDGEAKKKKKKKNKSETEEISSDSSLETPKKKRGKGRRRKKKSSSSSESELNSDSEEEKKKNKGKKRKRIKVASDSSEANDSGSDDNTELTPGSKKRRKIRKILKDKKLADETKEAAKAEEERRKRIAERQKLYNQVVEEDENDPDKCPRTTKLVLESDKDGKALIEVSSKLICKLKPHQVEAVKFLWECCVESLKRLKEDEGSGCILAHCMGLGKTLTVITFIHTLLSNKRRTKMRTCLVVCPLNVTLNWENELQKWFDDEDEMLDIYEMSVVKNNWGRADYLQQWIEGGGVMILGYEMYRNLSQHRFIKNKKQKKVFTECLCDPGPDLVVCDEGHVLKNDTSGIAKAMNGIRTKRRIVLTGTPLQNNLIEYHCMVNFVKPNLLGSRKEFSNRFVNPITNGQCSDSTSFDVKTMKRRAHVLHETLAGSVQRKDYSALTKFLPAKLEYVILVRVSPVQIKLYEQYLGNAGVLTDGSTSGGSRGGARLFSDYHNLLKIWTHPWMLKLDEIRQENKRMYEYDSEDSFLDDESDEEGSMSTHSDESVGEGSPDNDDWRPSRRRTQGRKAPNDEDLAKPGTSSGKKGSDSENEVVRQWKSRRRRGENVSSEEEKKEEEEEYKDGKVSNEWWAEHVQESDRYNAEISGKIVLLAELLKMAESIGDKLLVFSQSLLSLDLIEDFLEHWDKESQENHDPSSIGGGLSWVKGADYFRMDGSTSAQLRNKWSDIFNDPENNRARLFLISTKAGSLGINMVSANRVIIFDASWNPSHDIQSIFRVYRFGQTKPSYIYRFLCQGTMEEKIYERQVTKQSLSQRVVDEHQIERHFTQADMQELYTFKPDRLDDPDRPEKPTPILPKDLLLADLLQNRKDAIVSYHEHDSLLENKEEESLTEEERKAAWEDFEQEKKGLKMPPPQNWGAMLNSMQQQQNQHAVMNQQINHNYPQMIQVARALLYANPTMNSEELQMRLNHYIQVQQQQQQQHAQPNMYNSQQVSNMYNPQQEFARLNQMQIMEQAKLQQMREERRRLQQHIMQQQVASTGSSQALASLLTGHLNEGAAAASSTLGNLASTQNADK